MENNQEVDLLSGISAAFHELRESLSGRDADIAKTAERVCWQLNSELLRISPLLDAARAEAERLRELVRECGEFMSRVGCTGIDGPTREALLQRIEAELGEGDGSAG